MESATTPAPGERSKLPLPVLIAMGVAAVVGLGFFLVTVADSFVDDKDEHVTLSAPRAVGAWKQLKSPAAKKAVRRIISQMEAGADDEDVSAVAGIYQRPGKPARMVFAGINAEPSSDGDDELEDDPRKVVNEILDELNVTGDQEFNGDAEGAMSCGRVALSQSVREGICVWATDGATGQLRFAGVTNLKQAAKITHAFRKKAEHRG